MATSYTPLAAGATPTLGTSGDAVKQLQTQLNTTNAGQPGYQPLVVDGNYGPLTQAASTYVAPVTTPTAPTTDDTRYARTPNSNDATIAKDTTLLAPGAAPDLSTITATNRANAQGQIDAITAKFNDVINTDTATGNASNDRVRALNISSGLGGSDFGSANAVNQENKNAKVIQLDKEQRDAQISALLAGVDDRSSQQYQQQKADYMKSIQDDLDRTKAAKDADRATALNTVKGLAAQGVDIGKLKETDPTSYNTLLQEYGGSEMDLEGEWNAALPANLQTNYTDKIVQGDNGSASLLRYGLNPITNTVTTKEYPLDASYNDLSGTKPVTVNGRLFSLSTDANGKEIAVPLTPAKAGTGSGTGKPVKSGKATFTGDQISSFSSQLETSRGTDHYVDPDTYQQAYDAWTDPSVGGLAKDFLTQFPPSKYVNPKNTTLPTYLQSGKAKASTSRSST